MSSSKPTPMITQYLSIKGDYPDAILLFAHQDVHPLDKPTLERLPVSVRETFVDLLPRGDDPPLWLSALHTLIGRDGFGIAGVAGSGRLEPGRPWWQHEELSGLVFHPRDSGLRVNNFGPWGRVLALDGLFLMAQVATILALPPSQAS